MRDKHLAAVTATLLVVVAASVALTVGGERATPQATTQATSDERADATSVTLRSVTVERLQLQNTTIENATVDRLTIDRLTSDNRTITNGTFVDVEIASLQLPGVTAADLEADGPPATPGAENETTPGATPDAGTPMDEQDESAAIDSLRIATLSVTEATVGSVTFSEADATAEPTPAGEPTDTPMEPGTATETPMEPGTATETPMEPGTATETPMEPGTATATPGGAETPAGTPGTPTGSPVFDLQNQIDGLQDTPDGGDTGQGQSVAVQRVNVSELSVEEMVVTVAVSNATAETEGTPGTATTPGMDSNATDAGGTPGVEPGTPASPTEPGDTDGMAAADMTVAQLDVESATADRVDARLTETYGQYHVTNVTAPEAVQAGENYTVSFTVVNANDRRGVEYVGYGLGATIPSRQLLVLEPGEQREVTVNVTADDLAAGSYAQTVVTKESTVVQTVRVTNETETGTPGATPATTTDGEQTPIGGPELTPETPETETETPMEPGTETPMEPDTATETPAEGETPAPANETTTPGGPL